MLVLDASTIVEICLENRGWELVAAEELFAPPLAISEVTSCIHEAQWRGDLAADQAKVAIARLREAPIVIRPLEDPMLAWDIADELGWAKTYDAEYVALARHLSCRLVTVDARLQRGARRLVEIIGPADLGNPGGS